MLPTYAILGETSIRTLIAPTDAWTLWAVIVGSVAISIHLEQKYRWAAKVSGPLLALIIAILLSNIRLPSPLGGTLRIMPSSSPTYDVITDYLVPLAIPLLLMRANIFQIIRTAGWTFAAFHVSVIGTLCGAFVAALVFHDKIEHIAEVTGIMTGSYTGGGVNFFAVRASFDVPERLASALIVADNFVMAGMFVSLLFLAGSRWMIRHYPHPHITDGNNQDSLETAKDHWKRKDVSLKDIASAIAVAVTVTACASATAKILASNLASAGDSTSAIRALFGTLLGNVYVWITLYSTLLATFLERWVGWIHGAEELGSYLLYVFLFTIGLPADLVEVLQRVPAMFGLCLIIAVVNLIVTLSLGKLLRLNLEDLLISVNATLGGAPSAAAMAIAMGWPRLVLPGLLIGIWGYVIGTFLGVLLGETLRQILY